MNEKVKNLFNNRKEKNVIVCPSISCKVNLNNVKQKYTELRDNLRFQK